jgi:hypothetical protein
MDHKVMLALLVLMFIERRGVLMVAINTGKAVAVAVPVEQLHTLQHQATLGIIFTIQPILQGVTAAQAV